MRQLTVVQILPELHSGGVERGTLEVAKALVDAGHRSIVISHGGRMVAQLEREGSEHINLPVHRKSLKSLLQIWPLRHLLTDLQPDIVHARSRLPAWLAWLAWVSMPAARRPHFITTVHGLNSVNAYSAIMVKGERVIAVSETVRKHILEHYPQCPPDRIDLIFRGIDPREYPFGYQPREEWRKRWDQTFPASVGKLMLTLPGRVTRLKGHEAFIDLIEHLRKEGLPVHGVIAGGAAGSKQSYLNELERLVAKRGLRGDITFTGQRGDLRDVLAISTLAFSLSTKPETFGRTTLEALSIGVPVVGWDRGGVSEILRDRFPEGAVPGENTAALLTTTRALLTQPRQPRQKDSFLLQTMLDQTLALYQRVADGKQQ